MANSLDCKKIGSDERVNTGIGSGHRLSNNVHRWRDSVVTIGFGQEPRAKSQRPFLNYQLTNLRNYQLLKSCPIFTHNSSPPLLNSAPSSLTPIGANLIPDVPTRKTLSKRSPKPGIWLR